MTRKTLMALGLAATLTVPAAMAAQEQGTVTSDSAAMAKGRQYTDWFYQKEFSQLWEVMGPQMRQALGGSESILPTVWSQVNSQVGQETEVVEEEVTQAQGLWVYLRRARYSGFLGIILVQFAMDENGTVGGFFVRPAQ